MEVMMKTAAVSELKALLSKYLSKVKAGEEVVVTDRGRPIAKIVPIKRAEMEIPASPDAGAGRFGAHRQIKSTGELLEFAAPQGQKRRRTQGPAERA